jgi:hypothetical protein
MKKFIIITALAVFAFGCAEEKKPVVQEKPPVKLTPSKEAYEKPDLLKELKDPRKNQPTKKEK